VSSTDETAALAALVEAFCGEDGLSPEQQQQVAALGFTSLDEFAFYAAVAHLEGFDGSD
jgi:hypothetical protein